MTWIVHIHDGAAKQLKWTTSACSKRTLFLTLVMIQKILIDRLAPREAFGRAIQDLMRCARRAATVAGDQSAATRVWKRHVRPVRD